jgi:hypothetical protein
MLRLEFTTQITILPIAMYMSTVQMCEFGLIRLRCFGVL